MNEEENLEKIIDKIDSCENNPVNYQIIEGNSKEARLTDKNSDEAKTNLIRESTPLIVQYNNLNENQKSALPLKNHNERLDFPRNKQATASSQTNEISFHEYFSVFSVSLLCLAVGNGMGWMAPVMVKLQSGSEEIQIDKANINILPTVMIGCGLISPAIIAFTLNRFGRKLCLLIACSFFILGHLLLILSKSFYLFLMADACFGLGTAVSMIISSIYLAEISTPAIRGKFMTLMTIQKNFGVLIEFILGPIMTISNNSLVIIVIPTVTFALLTRLPETAHFYLFKGKTHQALESLKKLRSSEKEAIKQVANIQTAMEKEKEEKTDGMGILKRLLYVKSNRHALYLSLFLVLAREMCGVTLVAIYSQILVKDVKYLITPWYAGITLGVMNFIGACISAFAVDKFGRRKLLTLSTMLTSIPFGSMAVYFYLFNRGYITDERLSVIPIIFLLVFKLTSSSGADSIPAIITGESFPVGVKGVAILVVNMFHVVAQVSVINVFHYVSHFWGMDVSFGFLFVFCLFAAILQFIFVKETKRKTLEAVQKSFE